MRRQDFMLTGTHYERFSRNVRILGSLLAAVMLLCLALPERALGATITPPPTLPVYTYTGQPGTPAYLQNTFHLEKGCQWLGAAGQVINLASVPVPGLTVKLGGSLGGATLNMQSVTGTAADYGSGGFEFVLGNKPQTSMQSLWVQVYDAKGIALSEKVYFNTYNECSKNLVLVNFIARSEAATGTPALTPGSPTPQRTSTTGKPTATRTVRATATPVQKASITPAKTVTPATKAPSATLVISSTPAWTPSPTHTRTPAATPTRTLKPSVTSTATIKASATRTLSPTPAPSRTPSRTDSPVLTASRTPTPLKPTLTTQPTTPPAVQPTASGMPFINQYVRQPGSPAYEEGFAHPEKGCAWTGIAGQVFDLQGKPVRNLVVEVEGTLDGERISSLALTGMAPAYGAGGYEIRLADRVIASQGSLGILLYDLKGNRLISRTVFDTVAACEKNLVVMNFIAVKGPSSPTPAGGSATKTPLRTPTAAVTRTPTLSPDVRFGVQSGSPLYLRNIYRPDLGCNWSGIGGQVFRKEGSVVRDLVVEVGGVFEGKPLFGLGLTGASPRAGKGGYVIQIADHPAAPGSEVWVVLKRLDGTRLSDPITLELKADCNQNLVLLNFTETESTP